MSQTIEDFREFFKPNKQRVIFDLKDTYLKSYKLLSSKFNKVDIKVY